MPNLMTKISAVFLLIVIFASPVVQAGQVANDETISLDGTWEFYWNRLLEPQQFSERQAAEVDYIRVPSSWSGQVLGPQTNGGQPLPQFGYATYRYMLSIPQNEIGENKALFFRYIDSAFNIWIAGKRMEGLGNVGTNAEEEVPTLRMRMFYFTPQHTDVEIVIQVSNYSFRESGIVGKAMYGEANAVTTQVFRQIAVQDVMFISFFMLLSMYHLIVFFTRRNELSALWLGLLTLCIAIRTLLISEYLVHLVAPWIPWEQVIRMEYIFEALITILYVIFLHTMYPKDVHRLPLYINSGYAALLIVYFLVTDTHVSSSSLKYHWLVFVFILCYYLFYLGFITVKRKRPGAYLNVIGVLLIMSAILNDLFYYTGKLNTIPLASIMLLLYFLLQAVIISYRYSMISEENKKLASELKTVNIVLEEKVAERTEELNQMNIQLVKLDHQRTQLMENIAHDLGSPIVGAQTHVQLLKQGIIQGKQQEKAYSQLLSNLSYMKNLVQDLFDITGFERKKSMLHLQRMNVTQLWQIIGTVLSEKEEWEQVTMTLGRVQTTVNDSEVELVVDPVGISRVVQNYADNAIKFSANEPCPIHVEFFIRDREVVFEMSDEGKGISAEQLPHLFERFYKGEGFSKGAGLGLAIVKEIIEQHGGKPGVRSQLTKGSTFSFTLPLFTD
jgi:signal transduction histidine kinase